MAKKSSVVRQELTLQDLRNSLARGVHAAFGTIEKAVKNKDCKVCDEVWQWLSSYWENARALSLLKEHAPAFVPAAARKR